MNPSAEEVARVHQSAAAAFRGGPLANRSIAVGNPEQVYTIEGRPAYWLVPGLIEAHIHALARVFRDGRVATVGGVRALASDAGEAATGVSAAEASRVLKDLAAEHPGAQISPPMLVQDGPVGREAWLYRLKLATGETSHVFATAGGRYSRPSGETSL